MLGTLTRRIAFLVALLAAPLLATAQPMADRLPADTLVYVGWAGADSLGSQYQQSHLKAVLEASNVPKFLDEFLPKVFERMAQEQPQALGPLSGVTAFGKLWRKPCAFAFTGLAAGDGPRGLVPRALFVCRAGDDAAEFQRHFDRALRQQGPGGPPVPVKSFRAGDLVGVAVGYDRPETALAQQGRALAGSDAFKAAFGRVSAKEPAFVVYADAEAGIKLINETVQKMDDEHASEMWPRVREASGLGGLKRFVWAEGFDGKEWGTHVFVEAPAPRKGLLALLDAKPLSDDIIKTVPATATLAGVSRFDFGRFLDEVRSAVEKVSPDPAAVEHYDAALAQASNMLGMDFRKDVVGSLGDEWAYFTDPSTGGRGTMGLVVVNRLRDAAKAEQALTRIQSTVEAIVAQQTRGEKVHVAFRETKASGVTVRYVAIPIVTPAWAIHNGNLYVGLYPQVVASAASYSARGGKSLLDNRDFVALRQRLLAGAGNNAAASVSFMDLPKTAPSSYQTWLMVSSFARFGDLFGVESPDFLFPTMDVLAQHLTPAGSVSWSDQTGFHLRGVSPFPGSTLFAADTGGGMIGVQQSAMMMSVLLPSLNRAREQANRVKSASNLRQMGQAVQMFANENRGRFPDEIGQLLTTQDLTADVFVNPRGGTSSPGPMAGAEGAAWVRDNSDYVYVGKGKNFRATQDDVLAYEKPDGLTDGINVLFGDGHVEFVPTPLAMELIQTGRKPQQRRGPGGVRPPAQDPAAPSPPATGLRRGSRAGVSDPGRPRHHLRWTVKSTRNG